MGDERLEHQQNGNTLSYICEKSSANSLVKTHRITVHSNRWSRLQGVWLVLVVCICLGFPWPWPLPLVVFGFLSFLWVRRKRVVEEAIVVMPTLGMQLETVYPRRRVLRRFVPLEKIVAPVINEAVSPVSCYFYLALLLREEENLELTFLDLRPPLKMLVPIWRSLCEAVGTSVPELLASEEMCNAPQTA